MSDTWLQRIELKVPPLIWVLAYGLAMKACALWLPQMSWSHPFGQRLWPILVGLGLSLAVAGVMAVQRSQTTLNPMNPESTTALVDTGIYGLTRNPMYSGMLLILLGWGVFLQNILAIFLVGLWVANMNRFQIRPEERILEKLFGEAYSDYRRRVPRWLIRISSS